MVRQMTASGDIRGLHFCTLNLEKSVVRILEDLGWVGGSLNSANRLITVKRITYSTGSVLNYTQGCTVKRGRTSYQPS